MHTVAHLTSSAAFQERDTGEHHNGIDALLRTEGHLNKSKQVCFSLTASDMLALALRLNTKASSTFLVRFCS